MPTTKESKAAPLSGKPLPVLERLRQDRGAQTSVLVLTVPISIRGATMDRKQIVSRDPDIMNGALVLAGTRVPVEILIQHLAAGDSLDTFLEDFPSVSRDQAVAYLEMALRETEAGT